MKQIVIYKNQSELNNFILMLRGSEANGFKYVLFDGYRHRHYSDEIYKSVELGDEISLPFHRQWWPFELSNAIHFIDTAVKNDNEEEET